MDDPEIAFPLFEKAQSMGIKVVAIHKALPLGPVELTYYAMDDIDRAAMTFPDLQFEVVHGGMGFLDETAWQIARFDNVWINLESTATMLTTKPRSFEQALATFAARTAQGLRPHPVGHRLHGDAPAPAPGEVRQVRVQRGTHERLGRASSRPGGEDEDSC